MIAKKFQRMTYRQVQHSNSENKNKLDREDRIWLKTNKYKNVGWDNVINLFHKIEELQDREKIKDWSLEELFLESDRIGNKYLTDQEINDFNYELAKEVNKISELIDLQFPDSTIEIIDYSK
jgi:predicted Rossmann fold nucleotide-binding protein DprA/Smf involved in DNA uptake